MRISLDGKYMNTRELTHSYLKDKLMLPEYYGGNLDALWDVLSSHSEPLNIILRNKPALVNNLGCYGEMLIDLFDALTKENLHISFRVRRKTMFVKG